MAMNLSFTPTLFGAINLQQIFKEDFRPVLSEISAGIRAKALLDKRKHAGAAAQYWAQLEAKYQGNDEFWEHGGVKRLTRTATNNLRKLLGQISRLEKIAKKQEAENIDAAKKSKVEDFIPEEEPKPSVPWLPVGIGVGIIGLALALKG